MVVLNTVKLTVRVNHDSLYTHLCRGLFGIKLKEHRGEEPGRVIKILRGSLYFQFSQCSMAVRRHHDHGNP